MDAPARVIAYDGRWVADFAEIESFLRAALGGKAVIEHVGSTAVPGLAAKPIIDVDVVLPAGGRVTATLAALSALGYRQRGDMGVVGRQAFTVLPGLPYHHLYVVVAGSKPHRDHVDLRDYLRAHPHAPELYQAEKVRLAPMLTVMVT